MMKIKNTSKATLSKYSNGYGSFGTSWNNSSFWLDKDFDRTHMKNERHDVIKLAGYKNAVSNFVRIVTNKPDIKVQYSSGKQSYTDGKHVVISSKLDESKFDATVGLALHEGSHIKLTNFAFLQEQLNPSSSTVHRICLDEKFKDVSRLEVARQLKDLVNIIEDRRIDRYIYNTAPGYRGYYEALYNEYFNAPEIDQALLHNVKVNRTWDDYIFHICNFTNPNRQLSALPGLRAIYNLIDIPNIDRLANSEQVLDLAVEVMYLIYDHIQTKLFNKSGSDCSNSESQPEQNEEETNSGDENLDQTSSSESDETDSGDGGNGDEDSKDQDEESDSSVSDENSEDQDSGNNVKPLSNSQMERLKKKLDKAISRQKDFLNGEISKQKVSKSDHRQIEVISENGINYSDATYNGEKVKCVVISGGINQGLIDSNLLTQHISSQKPADIKARLLRQAALSRDGSAPGDYVEKGIALGIALGKRLKTRDEDRSIKTSRLEAGRIDRRLCAELGFGNDRIFQQVIHQTVNPALIHISIDASGSMCGDSWNNSIKMAVAIAKAASMIKSLDCVISLRGTIYIQNPDANPLMFVVYDSRKMSFAKMKNYFYLLQPNGSTPEGLCYDATLNNIIADANGKDAYFINICDGRPSFSVKGTCYSHEPAEEHTRKQVDKMRQAGIKVLAYFVVHSNLDATQLAYNSGWKAFRNMYGADSNYINIESLPQLAGTLNKLFTRK